ncbi:MAG: hypothetical protein PHD64_10160 [Mesotoga sp.]|jgi:hypothetical protein|nr:hypothetical protein [Mesotoga sp.]
MATKKGLSSVVITLDKPRTLRWPNGITREFEEWALDYIGMPKTGVGLSEGKRIVLGAEDIIMQALTTATLQSYALLFSLRHEDPKITIEQVDDLISAYKEAGKDYDELIMAIQRSFLLSNHPSSLASQEERWKGFKTMKSMEQKIQEKREKASNKKVAEAISQLEKQLNEIDSGEAPPALDTPSD